jgi:hypothetical protein
MGVPRGSVAQLRLFDGGVSRFPRVEVGGNLLSVLLPPRAEDIPPLDTPANSQTPSGISHTTLGPPRRGQQNFFVNDLSSAPTIPDNHERRRHSAQRSQFDGDG